MSSLTAPLRLGDRYTARFAVTQPKVERFAAFSGDDNPLHRDSDIARRLGFKTQVAHGAILLAEISRIIGTEMPGRGSLWLSSEIEFRAPVYVGTTVVLTAAVTHVSQAFNIVTLDLHASRENDGVTVLEGTATIKVLEESMPLTFTPLDRQHVLVSGGTRGLGRIVTRTLLRSGATVTALYHSDEESAGKLAQDVGEGAERLMTVRCDVKRSSDVAELFQALEGRASVVHSFVHAASPPLVEEPLDHLEWSTFEMFLETYIKGTVEIVQRMLPHFKRVEAGRVVLIGSEAVHAPRKNWTHYVTAKSAYIGLVRSLAIELADFGATVNLVTPGTIHTSDVLPANIKAMTRNATPLKRLVSEEEIAEVVAFLLERGGSFMSGANVPLTGGRIFP